MKKKTKLSDWWYSQTEKYKLCDWIDDIIINIKSKYRSIKHWFYCNWNKEHWRLVKQAFLSYGWDGYFIYELEEKQIDKQLKWFSKHQRMIDEQYNEIIWSLKLAKYLVHVINNETDLFHFTGSSKFNKISDGQYQYDNGDLKYHYDGPYINKRNLKRFLTNAQLKDEYFMGGNCDHEIYMIKCKYMYHRIREKYTDYWWD